MSILPTRPTPPFIDNIDGPIVETSLYTVPDDEFLFWDFTTSAGDPFAGEVLLSVTTNDTSIAFSIVNEGSIFFSAEVRPFETRQTAFIAVDTDRIDNQGVIFASGLNSAGRRGIDGYAGGERLEVKGLNLTGSLFGTTETSVNSGEIWAEAMGGTATGVQLDSSGANTDVFQNSGLIAAVGDSQGRDDSQSFLSFGRATGVSLTGGTVFENLETGRVIVESDRDAVGVYLTNVRFRDKAYAVRNDGLIEANSLGDPGDGHSSYGVFIQNFESGLGTFENHGTVTADFAVYAMFRSGASPRQRPGETVLNMDTGTLNGDVVLNEGFDRLENSGVINGTVDMGEDADVVLNLEGIINATVFLGQGADEYRGGESEDIVSGGFGNDQIYGGAGDDLISGGQGRDFIAGGAGNDGLYAEAGADIITSEGGDFIDAGAGEDVIQSVDTSFRHIEGGIGYDVWELPADDQIYSLGLIAASGRVTGIENIRLNTGHGLVIDSEAAFALSETEQTLWVSGAPEATVFLDTGWTMGATFDRDGQTYQLYTSGQKQLYLAVEIDVEQSDDLPVGIGFAPVASGDAAPLMADVPDIEPVDGPIITVDGYIIRDGLFLIEEGETWMSNGADGAFGSRFVSRIYLDAGEDLWPSIVNHGEVYASNLSGGRGNITSAFGGISDETGQYDGTFDFQTFDNYGRITAESILNGDARTITLSNTEGILTNYTGARINAFAFDGDALAVRTFGSGDPRQPAVDNRGLISAISENGFATGILAPNYIELRNSGDISVQGGNGGVGVDISITGGELLNTGTITVTTGKDAGFFGIGVVSFENTITNEGTISAEIAVYALTGDSGVVQLNNSGLINGDLVFAQRFGESGSLSVNNTGTIIGNAIFGSSNNGQGFRNDGLMIGDIFFTDKNDIYFGSGGELQGIVFGFEGDDTFNGGASADFFEGGAGADTFRGNGGIDTAFYRGSLSAITINLTTGTHAGEDAQGDTFSSIEVISASTFDDSLIGDAAANIFFGNEGDDLISGMAGADEFNGNAGSDLLNGGAGSDDLNGGGGFDTVSYTEDISGVRVNLDAVTRSGIAAGTAVDGWGDLDTLTALEFAIGSAFDDTIFGTDRRNTLEGGAGDDILRARSGDDTLIGGAGNDELNGQAGQDTADYSGASSAVDVDMGTGTAMDGDGGMDTLIGIERITASAFDDMFTGGTANDWLNAGDGADIAFGAAGNDSLFGEGGDDELNGDAGVDRLYGGDGDDTLNGGADTDVLDGGAGNDTINGEDGGDRIFARDGDDIISGGAGFDIINGQEGNDTINGGDDRDILRGQAGDDTIFGDAGDDTLSGDIGADTLNGGAGTDLLKGGDGDDTLTGGTGDDRLIGGDGIDTAIFSGNIADYDINFRSGVVRITDLSGTDGFDKLTQVEFLQFADGVIDVAGL